MEEEAGVEEEAGGTSSSTLSRVVARSLDLPEATDASFEWTLVVSSGSR